MGQSNTNTPKYVPLDFNVGINGNWMAYDPNFYGGFTGVGFLLEPGFSKTFSLVISFNFMTAELKKVYYPEYYQPEIGTTNFNLLFRRRWYSNKFSFYPELGFGNWSRNTIMGIAGLGAEYNFYDKIYTVLNFDYIGYCQECLREGSGRSGAHFRIVFGFSYYFEIKLKTSFEK